MRLDLLNKMEIKTRISIIEDAEKEFNFTSPIKYEVGTLICLKMETKFVKLNDIIAELKEIIDTIPEHSCDIDSSIIGDLINRLENE